MADLANIIKEEISCVVMFRDVLGYNEIQKPGDRLVNPWREDATALSLVVYENYWKDFAALGDMKIGCGDCIQAYANELQISNGEAIRRLAYRQGLLKGDPAPAKFEEQLRQMMLTAHNSFMAGHTDESLAYLKTRGIDDYQKWGIGFCRGNIVQTLEQAGYSAATQALMEPRLMYRRLTIPAFDGVKIRGFMGRSLDANAKIRYKKTKSCADHGFTMDIWGWNNLRNDKIVVITDGIFDAIPANTDDYAGIATCGGALSSQTAERLVRIIGDRDVIVVADYKPDGDSDLTNAKHVCQVLLDSGLYPRLCALQGKDKKVDLNSYWCEHGHIDCLKEAEPYAFELADDCQNPHQRRRFYMTMCQTMHPVNLAEIKNKMIDDGVSHGELQTIEQGSRRRPTEYDVATKLVEENQLLFDEYTGWYEYERDCWRKRRDNTIRQKISIICKRHASARLINGALNTAAAAANFDGEFNQNKGMLNMKNGMLNISTHELVPHSPNYYSSIQLPYEYNPKADCPTFKRVIFATLDEQEGRMLCLQEMFGYCLTADTQFNTCFLLRGSGANGKSVVLNTLEMVVASENVSHVSLQSMGNQFERYQIRDKLVNMATETAPDVKSEAMQFWKSITAGDPINIAHKHKQGFSYRPVCKLVFALNNTLLAKELTHATFRRCKFIDFDVTFSRTPTGKQRQAELSIEHNFIHELSGIFNWALDGLARLHEQGEFTATEDDLRASKEFLTAGDSVAEWLAEEYEQIIPYSGLRSRLFEMYDRWCNESQIPKRRSRPKFLRRIREITNCTEYKANGGRCIRINDVNDEYKKIIEYDEHEEAEALRREQGRDEHSDDPVQGRLLL